MTKDAVTKDNAITLDGMCLQSVALKQGSWWNIPKAMRELPDLRMLLLNMLYDDDISVPTEDDFSLYGESRHFECIKLDIKEAIIATVSMIPEDYRGTDKLGTTSHVSGEIALSDEYALLSWPKLQRLSMGNFTLPTCVITEFLKCHEGTLFYQGGKLDRSVEEYPCFAKA